ncbi:hypothetical protein ACP70R_026403 [Stipagrostis hirtigluma subsp. patula]
MLTRDPFLQRAVLPDADRLKEERGRRPGWRRCRKFKYIRRR